MKKILLTLFALTVFGQMYSQNENDIVVIRVLEDTKPTTRTNRSVALCPVECLYHTMTSMLELTFQPGLGEADVTLDNLSTGETGSYFGNNGMAVMTITVSPNSCYTMSIVTESGRTFKASFLTGDSEEDM